MQPVTPVAAEALVAPVAGQRHRHVLARELADAVGRDRRAVGIGLVVELRQCVDQVEIVALDEIRVVSRSVAIGDQLGKARLVEGRIRERDRAGVDRRLRQARHRRDNRARVDAAGEERPKRHFGDHAQAHRLVEAATQLLAGFGDPDRGRLREADVPVFAGFRYGPAAPDRQRVGRRKLARSAEDGARFGDVAQREVFLDRRRVDVAAQSAVREQRFQLGSEQQRAVGQQRVMQRLHPEAVAREEQRLPVAIPQREREHAAQALDTILAPGFPGVDDRLGVAPGTEPVAQRRQLGDQRLVVVDLAVVDDADAAVLVVERLLPGGKIDDRQPPVAQPDAGLDVQADLVRAAMMLRLVHANQRRAIDVAASAGVEDARDPAHGQ